MGQTPGMSGSQIGLGLLKGGLTGLGQGLQNYNNPSQGFDFSKLQQGFQARRQAFGAGVTPGAKKPLDPTNIDPFDPSSYGSGGFPR